MRTTWTFHSAAELIYGPGAARQLGDVVVRLGARRAFVVTDPVLLKVGLVDEVHAPLGMAGATVEIFSGGEPEPSLRAARASIAAAREFRPDVVIGLGGGSNMDLAKITAVVLAHGGDPLDYAGEEKVPGPIKAVVCMPTTAGTGSEVSGAAVLTDTDRQMKLGVLSNYLRPAAAIVDPLMTLSCPPKVTADCGIDALTHAIEAYTAVDNATFPLPHGERSIYQGRTPMGDLLAEKAICLIGHNLEKAVLDGSDVEAREGMALAATLAGMAFSNVGVAAVHALEYPVGAAVHCSHGAGNGLLLPHVMRYNLPERAAEFRSIARLLGESVEGLTVEAAAERAVARVEQMSAAVGIPRRLRDLAVKEEQLRPFAEKAFAVKRILRVNPRTPTVDDLEAILRAAF